MKNGKKLTLKQKKFLQEQNLDPAVWLVVKDMPTEIHLVHRYSNSTTRIIPKERG